MNITLYLESSPESTEKPDIKDSVNKSSKTIYYETDRDSHGKFNEIIEDLVNVPADFPLREMGLLKDIINLSGKRYENRSNIDIFSEKGEHSKGSVDLFAQPLMDNDSSKENKENENDETDHNKNNVIIPEKNFEIRVRVNSD